MLSRRLAAAYALIITAVLCLVSVIVFSVCRHFLISRQEEALQTVSELVSAQVLEFYHEGESLKDRTLFEDFSPVSGEMNIYLHTDEGQLLNQSINFYLNPQHLSFPSPARPVLRDDLLLFFYSQEVTEEQENLGVLTLVLNLRAEYDFLRMLLVLLLFTVLSGGLAALLLGLYTGRKMLLPLRRLSKTAAEIDALTLSRRLVVPKTQDEFEQLALNLNLMLDRIEDGFNRQGQFVADASHELRTPLAILQGNADLLSRWGHSDPQVLQSSLSSIARQIEYMNKLVSNLLFLARADRISAPLQKETIELLPFLQVLMEDREILDQSHRYTMECPEHLFFSGDHDMLFQMLSTLLDNSMQYTPAGGSISLSAREEEGELLLCIADTGIGIAPEHLPHIFSRFYRVDKARSRATGGLGLGLSIAQTIVHLHKGRMEAQSQMGEGTRILIRFPLS